MDRVPITRSIFVYSAFFAEAERANYACCPGSRDYTLLANANAEYLSVFELTHERVQNRQHTQKMKGADAHAR